MVMRIDHWLWLLAIDIYTKKCGYGYNPFWLLPIFHVYTYNPLAIGHCPLIIGVAY
jgi:hypothetical protein